MNEIDRTRLALSRASHLASALASKREEPEETLHRTLDAASAVLQCDIAVVALVEPSRTSVSVQDATDGALRSLRMPIGGLAGSIAGWNRGEVVPDAVTDPRRDELVEKAGMRRTVCAPIRVKGQPRGTLIAASRTAGARQSDASDLLLLGLFADLAAVAIAEIEERRETAAFHDRLSLLASRSFDRVGGDDFDPVLRAVARERGVELEDASCDPVLPELGRALRADAVALAAPDGHGVWKITESWGLPDTMVESWSENTAEVTRLHRSGGFSCVACATAFPAFDQDLRVLFRGPAGPLVLHVLARSSRGAFAPSDLRCAEMAAVRLGWSVNVSALEDEVRRVRREAMPVVAEEELETAGETIRVAPAPVESLEALLPAGW